MYAQLAFGCYRDLGWDIVVYTLVVGWDTVFYNLPVTGLQVGILFSIIWLLQSCRLGYCSLLFGCYRVVGWDIVSILHNLEVVWGLLRPKKESETIREIIVSALYSLIIRRIANSWTTCYPPP